MAEWLFPACSRPPRRSRLRKKESNRERALLRNSKENRSSKRVSERGVAGGRGLDLGGAWTETRRPG